MALIKCEPEEYQAEVESDLPYYKCVRGYVCEECGDKFAEVGKRIGYKFKKKCPSCLSFSLDSIIMGDITMFVENVTTVGQLAERDNKKLGKYGVEDRCREIEKSRRAAQEEMMRQSGADMDKIDIGGKGKNKKWYNPEGKDLSHLADLSAKGKEKYIKTGKIDKNV